MAVDSARKSRATPSSASRRPHDRLQIEPIRVSLALLVAFAAAIASLHVLFKTQTWWIVVMIVVVTVLGVAAGTRYLTPRRFVPTAASVVALIALMTLLFAPGYAILGIVPFGPTLERFRELLGAANESIYRQGVPADAVAPIVFVVALGLGLIAMLADLVAITGRRPALVGPLLLVIIAIPVVTRPDIADPLWFAVTAGAYLVLLMAGRPGARPGLAVSIGAAAIIASLFAPILLPAVESTAANTAPGLSTGVNPILRLGDDLRQQSARAVIRYSTQTGAAHYLRLVTLEDFTGDEWAPTPSSVDRNNDVERFGSPPGLSDEVATSPETSSIEVSSLSSRWLPLPYPPTSLRGTANEWYWDTATLAVTSPGNTSRGEQYEVESLVLNPTPEQLLTAGTVVSEDFTGYTTLPEDLPDLISTTATSVAGAAATNYEKAIALQEYFRSDAFEYSEEAPVDGDYDGTGMDIVATFLEKRSGYCVHFASSMAIMARSLGIPSRVVVGFLPGDRTSTGGEPGFSVSTDDLHAWPELFFDGIGWVQFEPTPGRGAPASYADVSVAGVPAPAAPDGPAPGVTPSAAPSAAPSNSATQNSNGDPASPDVAVGVAIPWQLLVLFAVIALALVPAVMRSLQRQKLARRLRSGVASAVDAWVEVLRTAVDLGIKVTPTETPRESAITIGATGPSLDALVRAVELEGYAAEATRDVAGLWSDVRTLRRQLFERASGRRTVLATILPASLWRRITHPLTVQPLVERTRVTVDA